MDFDNPYNSLSYDEKLLNEKLSLNYTNPLTFDDRLHAKHYEKERLKKHLSKEIQQSDTNRLPDLKPLNNSSNQPITTNHINITDFLFQPNTLLFFIGVLLIVCVIQYIHQQQIITMTNEIITILTTLLKNNQKSTT